jgi:hypothetical protein
MPGILMVTVVALPPPPPPPEEPDLLQEINTIRKLQKNMQVKKLLFVINEF